MKKRLTPLKPLAAIGLLAMATPCYPLPDAVKIIEEHARHDVESRYEPQIKAQEAEILRLKQQVEEAQRKAQQSQQAEQASQQAENQRLKAQLVQKDGQLAKAEATIKNLQAEQHQAEQALAAAQRQAAQKPEDPEAKQQVKDLAQQVKQLKSRLQTAEAENQNLQQSAHSNAPAATAPQPSASPIASSPAPTSTSSAGLLPFEPETVAIPEGDFLMGSPESEAGRHSNEGPQHTVHIKAFRMGKTEVTFAQYDAFAEATGREKPNDEGMGRGNRPVINVNWHDAQAYAAWLSQQTRKHYRLPTEAEWEYAARAGTTTRFYTGYCISTQQANYHGKSYYADHCSLDDVDLHTTQPVASYPPNPWGLYDMAGNVEEWTCSAYTERYTGQEVLCSQGRFDGVLRDSSWNGPGGDARSANRSGMWNGFRIGLFGFRLALG